MLRKYDTGSQPAWYHTYFLIPEVGKIQLMKRYTKKAAGLIFLLLATSVTFGLLVAFQFYISAIVTFALILFEGFICFT